MSTRSHVLDALRDAGAAGISGETLARLLGVSRVAVGKHVAALREAGYVVEAVPGTGYRLVSAPDLALPAEVAQYARDPLWHRFEGGEETGSTNDDARALARSGAEQGTVVVAARQTAGRGRMGRTWVSPPGGAYVSAVLRPPLAPLEVGPLALVVGLGVARGLEAHGFVPFLKWPNDVKLASGKVAGILLEMSAESDNVDWVVAGVGLNVIRPQHAEPGAAYLSDVLEDVGPARAAASVLDGIAGAYAAWLAQGFESLREEYEARSELTGHEVVVSDAYGEVKASGTVLGIDSEGRLLVTGQHGVGAIAAGEVTLRPR